MILLNVLPYNDLQDGNVYKKICKVNKYEMLKGKWIISVTSTINKWEVMAKWNASCYSRSLFHKYDQDDILFTY
jgi:hypothetical protein